MTSFIVCVYSIEHDIFESCVMNRSVLYSELWEPVVVTNVALCNPKSVAPFTAMIAGKVRGRNFNSNYVCRCKSASKGHFNEMRMILGVQFEVNFG